MGEKQQNRKYLISFSALTNFWEQSSMFFSKSFFLEFIASNSSFSFCSLSVTCGKIVDPVSKFTSRTNVCPLMASLT